MTAKCAASNNKNKDLAAFQPAPLALAVRQTLAISMVALSLAGSGEVLAASCSPPVGGVVNCPGDASDPDYPAGISLTVDDLFLTIGGPEDIPTVVNVGTAVFADGGVGTTTVLSYGDVTANGTSSGKGIDAIAYGDIAITNPGAVTVNVTNDDRAHVIVDAHAVALSAYATAGDVMIDNSGAIAATTRFGGTGKADVSATGMRASTTHGDIAVINSGVINTYAVDSHGLVIAYTGSGDVVTTGIDAYTAEGHVDIGNSGIVTATAINIQNQISGSATATAIRVAALAGNVAVTSSGAVTAAGTSDAAGIAIIANHGDVGVANSGALSAIATNRFNRPRDERDTDAYAYGIQVTTADGDAVVDNSGFLTAVAKVDNQFLFPGTPHARIHADGINAAAAHGDAMIHNTGTVSVVGHIVGGEAVANGIKATAADGDVTVINSGALVVNVDVLSAYSSPSANGIEAIAQSGDVHVTNSGEINAVIRLRDGGSGIRALSGGLVEVTNTGNIQSQGNAFDLTGPVVNIANAGGLRATVVGGPFATAAGVAIHATESSTLLNTGTIGGEIDGSGAAFAVLSDRTSADYVRNEGTLNGAVALGAGNDRLVNVSSDTWNASGISSFGDGDDTLVNAGRNGNSLPGRIRMTNATIDLGAFTSTGNVFSNAGVIDVIGNNYIRMGAGNPHPFTNTGTLNLANGNTSDRLTVVGNFAGAGALNLDVDADTRTSDQLNVQGSVVGGQTTINAQLSGRPTSAHTTVDLVNVSGTSTPDAFVLGTVSGVPQSFLAFDYELLPNPANAGVSLRLDAAGLSASGALLTSLSPAVQNLWHTAVGNRYQREGAARDQFAGALGVWVRGFGNDGTLSPAGTQANADFDQENQGFEAGFEFAPQSDLRIGVLAGQAKAKIDLDASTGRADIDGDTFGAYLTWRARNGAYADLSYRWMNIDADTHSSIGSFSLDGDADGWSFEAGYPIRLPDGMIVEPQFQFSALEVELDDVSNSLGTIALDDGESRVARAGAQIRKTYAVAEGVALTPSWSVNAVTEMEGKNRFSVDDTYRDKTDLSGTSLLAEGGLNVKLGTKVEVFGGMNYQDGGAYDSIVGGQVGVRGRW